MSSDDDVTMPSIICRCACTRWSERMLGAYGRAFLVLTTLVYLITGMYETSSVGSSISSLLVLWLVPPLFGLVSDRTFRKVKNVHPYIVLSTSIYVTLVLLQSLSSSSGFGFQTTHFGLLITLALVKVVVDGQVVSMIRDHSILGASDLQVLLVSMSGLGMLVSNLLSRASQQIILLTLALIMGPLAWSSGARGEPNSTRRQIDEKKTKPEVAHDHHHHHRDFWARLDLISQNTIFRTCCWLLGSVTIPPTFDRRIFFLPNSEEEEDMTLDTTGVVVVVGARNEQAQVLALGSLVACVVFITTLRHVRIRVIFRVCQLTLVTLSFLEFLGLVVPLGLDRQSSKFSFLLRLLSTLEACITTLKHLPTFIVLAQLCPVGFEATLFGSLMMILKIGTTMSVAWGTFLTWSIGHQTCVLLLLRMCCTILPLTFLFLLPLPVEYVTLEDRVANTNLEGQSSSLTLTEEEEGKEEDSGLHLKQNEPSRVPTAA